jgi:hypothetical protein
VKLALTAVVAAAAALFAASMLGVAVAEAPTVTSLRTVNVEGVATLPVPQEADSATASGVYHQAMAAAIDDGKTKAEVLAGKIGASLGAPQTITEDGGEVECSSGSEEGWEPYKGERPDFGTARTPTSVFGKSGEGTSAPASSAAPVTPALAHRKHKKKHKSAKKSSVPPGCRLAAQVSLVYLLG